jgi:oligopeptidase B
MVSDNPPVAKTVPFVRTQHGIEVPDEYAWLQNKQDPEVIAYLEAENAYARAALAHTEQLQEQIFQELRGRIKEDDQDAPYRHGGFLYYTRVEAGKQYRLFCRRRDEADAPEELLLDENALAEGRAYCRVGRAEPSNDHTLLAYLLDTTGSWVFEVFVKDLRTGEMISGPIPQASWSLAWANDSRTLFYTVENDAHRPYKLMRHTVGTNATEDAEVYHEPDEAFNLSAWRTRSDAYILLTAGSQAASEVRFLPADQPEGTFQLIALRRPWIEYYVEHHGDRFLIRTNEESAENFKLMAAPTANPGREQWREVIAHRADTLIEGVSAFRDHVVVWERSGGFKQVRISNPDGVTNARYVSFPEPVYTVNEGANPEFDTTTLRFHYTSLVTPNQTVDYDVATGAWTVVKQQEIPSGYDPSQYLSERLLATATDGTAVPISIVYRRDFARDGTRPLVLYGYGSYGFSMEPWFDAKRLSLLDRGFAFAIGHIRGGSELGRRWYEQGRLGNKKNSFTDFIACAEHLVAQGYTSPERLAIMGGSAGGLLVTAAANMRPELFRAVLALVPFTNVITAMLMPELPLTVMEWEQWGNPADEEAFRAMLAYSPYDMIEAKDYPQIFVRAGLNDLQVPYWDPAKYVARLRARKTDVRPLLLLTNMGAGHGGASGRYDALREDAEEFAFLIDALGA